MNIPALKYVVEPFDDLPSQDPEKVNILIVDDLPEKILVYKTILEDLNQNLITAHSGEEALKLVLKHEFAVILLDVNMPSIDGFETASLIRKRKKSARTPIIFLTAFTDEINIAQGYASGAVDYLSTPVVPEVLKAKIRVFIELYQMRQQAMFQAQERARREAAEEADRRKDEFLATLAHELRNPLAPLRNALQLLQLPNLKPDMIHNAYQIMDRQLQHMVRLVDDLMDVSRITRGKIELRLEHATLQNIIENAVETVKTFIEERQHTLVLDIQKEPIVIKADVVRISQVFANLLNNAAKYTDPGGKITITVTEQNGTANICIRDTGVGIAREQLPNVFDIFMQIDSSLTRAQGGLGIGLTLVRNLVEMHQGSVEAQSDGLNKGSAFFVNLPSIKQKNAALRPESRSHVMQPPEQEAYKILIVDDNEASAKTLGWMLEILGHEVILAFNGPEALERSQIFKPHVVLLDIGLPKMSGYEVCEAMRQQVGLENTVFAAQTGWGQEEHRRRSREAGFHHHLVKPISSESLQSILNSISERL
jgi:signal transduction histidine kinase